MDPFHLALNVVLSTYSDTRVTYTHSSQVLQVTIGKEHSYANLFSRSYWRNVNVMLLEESLQRYSLAFKKHTSQTYTKDLCVFGVGCEFRDDSIFGHNNDSLKLIQRPVSKGNTVLTSRIFAVLGVDKDISLRVTDRAFSPLVLVFALLSIAQHWTANPDNDAFTRPVYGSTARTACEP
ncbi:hypothetical protein BDV97DRAFT_349565, partial [Delphinella strobiligena]